MHKTNSNRVMKLIGFIFIVVVIFLTIDSITKHKSKLLSLTLTAIILLVFIAFIKNYITKYNLDKKYKTKEVV